MNFFLYSKEGIEDDFIMVDRLVERASRPYDKDFVRLALFAFHLANSGKWRHSKWPEGRVAGWANLLIREVAWKNGTWTEGAFQEKVLKDFIDEHIIGEAVTRRKILTNYRYMLKSAGVLAHGKLQPIDLAAPWFVDATQLFWDRQVFDGALPASAQLGAFKELFFKHEIHKLLGCGEQQGNAFVVAAFHDYSKGRIAQRYKQLQDLKPLLLGAA